jgi:hypothetical protein
VTQTPRIDWTCAAPSRPSPSNRDRIAGLNSYIFPANLPHFCLSWGLAETVFQALLLYSRVALLSIESHFVTHSNREAVANPG